MIGVDMTLEDVFDIKSVLFDVGDNGFVVLVRGAAGGGVVVEDRVEDDGLFGGWVGDEVGHC